MFNGFYEALLVLAGYLLINLGLRQYSGAAHHGTWAGAFGIGGIFVVDFWGWLLGPVGMLLSVPLTIIVIA